MTLPIAKKKPARADCFLICCFLICAIPGVIAVISSAHGIMGGDGPGYHQIAVNLLQRHIFSAAQIPPYEPTTFRTPGYPLFLAAIYAFTNQSIWAVRIAQLALLWLSAWGTAQIATHFFSRSVGAISACLLLLYLPFISYV